MLAQRFRRRAVEMKTKRRNAQRDDILQQLTKRELHWLELVLAGESCNAAGLKAGFSKGTAAGSTAWIRAEREDSKKPHLWDIWRKALDKRLRILDVNTENIFRELAIIGFSSIDKFIEFPSRRDAELIELKDAKTREFIGIATEKDQRLIAKYPSETGEDVWKKYQPGVGIRLKSIEDIPKELIPAIAELHETKDGIRIKLHSKLDALDKLCRIKRLFEGPSESPNIDREINIIVQGSKSKLLPQDTSVTINI